MLVTFNTQEVVDELIISDSMDNTLASKNDIHKVIDHVLSVKSELSIDSEIIKNRLAIVEKTQWIIIAGILALVFKSFLF